MKTILSKSVIAIVLAVFSCLNVSAQEKKIYEGEIPVPVKNEKNSLRENRNAAPSKEVIDFQNKMRAAKESGDRNESKNLLKEIEISLRKRKRGASVRLEILKTRNQSIKRFLAENLDLTEQAIYEISGPLDVTCFFKFILLDFNSLLISSLFTNHLFARFYSSDRLYSFLNAK